jgi:N-acetylneuraminic acid mutarotase
MIVWGGDNDSNGGELLLNTGGRYDPATESWTATNITSAPEARLDHTAVWTGSEIVIWGGFGSSAFYLNTGGRYDPATDSWTATSTASAPEGRNGHTCSLDRQ